VLKSGFVEEVAGIVIFFNENLLWVEFQGLGDLPSGCSHELGGSLDDGLFDQ